MAGPLSTMERPTVVNHRLLKLLAAPPGQPCAVFLVYFCLAGSLTAEASEIWGQTLAKIAHLIRKAEIASAKGLWKAGLCIPVLGTSITPSLWRLSTCLQGIYPHASPVRLRSYLHCTGESARDGSCVHAACGRPGLVDSGFPKLRWSSYAALRTQAHACWPRLSRAC